MVKDPIEIEFEKTRAAMKLTGDGVPYQQAMKALEKMAPEEISGIADGSVEFSPGETIEKKGLAAVAAEINSRSKDKLQKDLRADRDREDSMKIAVLENLQKAAGLSKREARNVYMDVVEKHPSRSNTIFESLLRGDIKYVSKEDFETDEYAGYQMIDPE